jgi:TRAP-type C4-dicarboxylate transport system permease small subunit
MNPLQHRPSMADGDAVPLAVAGDMRVAGARRPLLPPAPAAPWPIRFLGAIVDWTVVSIGAAMIVLVFTNVIFHAFQRDIAWTTELCELLMVWVSFLGAASVTRRGGHMAITEFVDKLGPRKRLLADAVLQAAAATILGMLVVYGWRIVVSSWGNMMTVIEVPMSLHYAALPVGSALTLVFVLHDLWQIAHGVGRNQRYGD